MDDLKYKQKLIDFNNTKKYQSEMHFMRKMIAPNFGMHILDYGCGTGAMANFIENRMMCHLYRYDKTKWNDEVLESVPIRQYTRIYMMHSIAHIENIEQVLLDLRPMLTGTFHVLTPNEDWLHLQEDEGYVPDPTVINHFNQQELIDLFTRTGYVVRHVGQFGELKGTVNERIYLEAGIE
jgi:2-polyprenyl-3-methyl-5-hydroxy-6-metoxy-1,4-benzoquinol methylase